MSYSPSVVADLFKAVQENASPRAWSQGVTLTRGSTAFWVLSQDDDECVVSLKIPGLLMSPKVTLWPSQSEWDCDCEGAENPCAHVAATVIALKKGDLKEGAEAPAPGAPAGASGSASLARFHYRFLRSPEGLRFERSVALEGGTRKPFAGQLMSYLSGVRAGRVSGPEIMAAKEDFAADQALAAYRGEPLDRKRLEALFSALSSDQAIYLDEKAVTISSARLLLQHECADEGEGYRLRRIRNPQVTEAFPHGVVLCGDTLQLVQPVFLTPEERSWIEGATSYFPPSKEGLLAGTILPRLRKKISIRVTSLRLPQAIEIPPRVELRLERDQGPQGQACLSVLANVVYGDPPLWQLNYDTMELNLTRESVASGRKPPSVQRNPELERQLMRKLSTELQLQPGRRVRYVGAEAVDFVRKVEGQWDAAGDGLDAYRAESRELEAVVEVGERDGYSFGVHFRVPGEKGGEGKTASFEAVFRAWQQNSNEVPLLDGSWAKLPSDWVARHGKKVRDFLAAREASEGDKVPPHRVPELATLCAELSEGGAGASFPDSLAKLRTRFEDFRRIEDAELPRDLTAQLRVYQRQGVSWLSFLRDSGLGAMLADDMGLGKTLQMLCAIKGRTLVVAPTSVIFNWAQEIRKFRPSLKVTMYYGAKRELDPRADVVLTSYGVLRLDQERLRAEEWDTIVLDEAQTIKNPDSQVARAAHSLRAKFRAALSGTPVENRLDDLWSQFHFLQPGLLGTRDDFLERYARPIGRGEVEIASRLKRKVKPFILRRLKREVAPELPPRTELVLHCELTTEERATYDAILASTKAEVIRNLEGGGSVLEALEIILRLRQAACHPALIPGQKADTSSKLELLAETIEESIAEGHKSLIFSQWTSFLDLIGAELGCRGVRFSRIDGSTRDRQGLVNEFQGDGGPPVMLISLKAGGVGLTLTAADHVFILDPWWNPAVEDQAADRAHRIGQPNPVFIHRLVARDTVEEKILALQENKKDLARAVLDEGGAALQLTRQDLMDLLT